MALESCYRLSDFSFLESTVLLQRVKWLPKIYQIRLFVPHTSSDKAPGASMQRALEWRSRIELRLGFQVLITTELLDGVIILIVLEI